MPWLETHIFRKGMVSESQNCFHPNPSFPSWPRGPRWRWATWVSSAAMGFEAIQLKSKFCYISLSWQTFSLFFAKHICYWKNWLCLLTSGFPSSAQPWSHDLQIFLFDTTFLPKMRVMSMFAFMKLFGFVYDFFEILEFWWFCVLPRSKNPVSPSNKPLVCLSLTPNKLHFLKFYMWFLHGNKRSQP